MCSVPFCSHCTPRHQENSVVKYADQSPVQVQVPTDTRRVTRTIWMTQVKNSILCQTGVQIRSDTWREQVGFCDCHFQGLMCKKIYTYIITSTKICLHFKMISIYISYELIHACSHPPRTPTPRASLLSFLKIASFEWGSGVGIKQQWVFIMGGNQQCSRVLLREQSTAQHHQKLRSW